MITLNKTLLSFAIALLPFSYVKLFYNFSISDLFFSLSFFCFICYVINKKKSFREILSNNDFILPLSIFSIGFFLSMHNSFDPLDSFLSFLQVIFIFIVIYYCLNFHQHTDRFLKNVLYLLLFSSIFITTFVFLFFLTGVDYSYGLLLVEQGWGMVRFSYGDMEPNITARIMAQCIPIILLFSMESRSFIIKIFTILCILLLLSIILLTASRTGLIIVALGTIFYFLFYFRYKGKYNLFRISAYIFFLTVLLYFIYQSFPNLFQGAVERYSTILDPSYSASTKERIFILEKSITLIDKHPFIGYGFGNSYNITGIAVHNSILISWLENGLFGFIGYCLLYIIILYYIMIGYSNRFFNNNILMVLAVISIMMIMGDMFMANSYKRSLWVPVILFVVYSKQLYKISMSK